MRPVRIAALVVGTVATVAVGAGGLVAVRAGEALPGTTVSGVDVGGLGVADIRSRLQDAAAARSAGTLEVVDGERRFPVDRSALGVQVDLTATADLAVQAGRTGSLRDRFAGPLLGWGQPVELAVSDDPAAVRAAVEGIAGQVEVVPFPGGFTVSGTTVTARQPEAGRAVDRDRAVADVEQALAAGRTSPLPLPVREVRPDTTAEQVSTVTAAARLALAGPYRLTAPSGTIELTPGQLGPLLKAESTSGGLRLGVDREKLQAIVAAAVAKVDRAPRDARLAVVGSQPVVDSQGDITWTPQPASVTVTPGAPGVATDVPAAVEALAGLVGTATREAPLPAKPVEPTLSTAAAESAGITSVIGSFTTYFPGGAPRATNIRRIAEILDGSYIPPGEKLSLNGIAGERTPAKGFVKDKAIIDGQLVDQYGGGVSQFATTLFNAGFFAGLPIEAYQPHSFYITRYPAGRESTVNFPSIDVVLRNDTAHGLLVRSSATDSSVTVSLYGDNGGRVVSSTSGPREPNPDGGFSISVTRSVTGGDGKGGRRTFRTRYVPPPPA